MKKKLVIGAIVISLLIGSLGIIIKPYKPYKTDIPDPPIGHERTHIVLLG